MARTSRLGGKAMDILEHFRRARRMETVPQGTPLFRTGDAADFMYVLMEGQANIMVGRTIVEIAGPGSLLGEMALVDRQPHLRRMNENLDATQPIGGVNVRVTANTSRSMEEAADSSSRAASRGEGRPS